MKHIVLFSLFLLLIGSLACHHRKETAAETSRQPAVSATNAPEKSSNGTTPQPLSSPRGTPSQSEDGIPEDMNLKDRAESRFGKLCVAAKEGDYHHKLYFNGKEISEYEGPIRLYEVFNGQDRDYLVGANDSGGTACPLQPFILEIYDRERSELFNDFGDCHGDITPRFVSDQVILEIPPYFPHPDLIPPKELKEGMKKMEVFTWQKGKLIKQERVPVRH